MRISDWSSDVCSSDLPSLATLIERCPKQFRCVVKRGRPQETDIRSLRSLLMSRHRSRTAATHIHTQGIAMPDTCNIIASPVGALKLIASDRGLRAVLWEHDSPTRVRIGGIGRASCRERVCQWVEILVVAGSLKKTETT